MRLQRWEEALEWARQTVREPHSVFWPYAHIVVSLVQLERLPEAKLALTELLNVEPTLTAQTLANVSTYLQDRETLETVIKSLSEAGLPE